MRRMIVVTVAASFAFAGAAWACECPFAKKQAAEQRAEVFAAADADADGALSIEEFDHFRVLMKERRAEKRFDGLDTDGDGRLTAEELTDTPQKPCNK